MTQHVIPPRRTMPPRRLSITEKISHPTYNGNMINLIITAGIAGSRVNEIFTSSFKTGSDNNALISDGCVFISLLLQHGYTAKLLLDKLCDPPSFFGSILRAAMEIDRSCAENPIEVSYEDLHEQEDQEMPEKQFKLTTNTYRLNPLVDQAKESRLPDHVGSCKSCGAPVSAYEADTLLYDARPEARGGDWMACDNGDCEHARGSFPHNAESWVQLK